jgi:pyridoxal phosphate enzyme (YggS family)
MTAYMDHKDLTNESISATRAQEIADGVQRVSERIAAAEQSYGRDAHDVRLLAATKTRDVGEIMAAIDSGIRLIGENRPQEIATKAAGLRAGCAMRGFSLGAWPERDANDAVAHGAGARVIGSLSPDEQIIAKEAAQSMPHIPFHLIGQLQSNKIGKVLPQIDTIESVDSLALAEKISRRAVASGITVGILLEVNESGEQAKSGCSPKHAMDFAQRIGIMGGLRLQGLMTIGAHVDDERTIRQGFEHLRKTRDLLLQSGEPGTRYCRELSMGMSNDLEFAIAEGSTIVRVGTDIFGERAFV